MPRHQPQIIIHQLAHIAALPNAVQYLEEFRIYKEQSFQIADDYQCDVSELLPVLPQDEQEQYPPEHPLFGRDRIFCGHYQGAANDPIYHVHLNDYSDGLVWDGGDEGVRVNQWSCTSDSALIYAYLETASDDYHFLVLDIISPGAHAHYEIDGMIASWRRQARDFRFTSELPVLMR